MLVSQLFTFKYLMYPSMNYWQSDYRTPRWFSTLLNDDYTVLLYKDTKYISRHSNNKYIVKCVRHVYSNSGI